MAFPQHNPLKKKKKKIKNIICSSIAQPIPPCRHISVTPTLLRASLLSSTLLLPLRPLIVPNQLARSFHPRLPPSMLCSIIIHNFKIIFSYMAPCWNSQPVHKMSGNFLIVVLIIHLCLDVGQQYLSLIPSQ